jgi:protein-disulfide isomerase
MNMHDPSDDEILAGLRRRLSDVEPSIPLPPHWQPATGERVGGLTPVRMRNRHAFGGLVPMGLMVVLIVAAVGAGFGIHGRSGAGGATPTADASATAGASGTVVTETLIVYRLLPPAGHSVTDAELNDAASVIKARAVSSGAGASVVTPVPPDQIEVTFPGGGDATHLQMLLGMTGQVEIVLLPPAQYGTSQAAGPKEVPAKGALIDPSLPAQFTSADLDPSKAAAHSNPEGGTDWVVDFAFTPSAAVAFGTWSGAHVNEYFAIAVDGVVESAPYVKSAITGGSGVISGAFTEQDAIDLATIIGSGPLPMPVSSTSEKITVYNGQLPSPYLPAVTAPPEGSPVQLVYRVGSSAGAMPSTADLESTAQIMKGRLMGGGDATVQLPDEVIVTSNDGTDLAALQSLLENPGRKIEFVPLPPASYGKAGVAGTRALPKPGDTIDPSLPAQFHGTQIDPGQVLLTMAEPTGPTLMSVGFLPSASSSVHSWLAAHPLEYMAVVVDGKVAALTSVPPDTQNIDSLTLGKDLTQDQLTALAGNLSVGELPLPVTLVSALQMAAPSTGPTPTPVMSGSGPLASSTPTGPAGVTTGRTIGDPAAPVTLDVWGDFRCPACAVFATQTEPQVISSLVQTGKVKIAYHDLIVIDSHTTSHESRDAANAAWCAADQGKFQAYSGLLWANQSPTEADGVFTPDRLVQLGREAGLDMTTFEPCVRGGLHDADVSAESASAPSSAVAAPALFVNGRMVVAGANQNGLPTYKDIAAAVALALASGSQPSPAGPLQ